MALNNGNVQTPCLLLDAARMRRNIARLKVHLKRLGVPLRPHLKTSKCIEVARLLMPTAHGPATVSTLNEAEEFAAGGVRDIVYAVGIAPNKLDRVIALRKRDVDLSIVLDSLEQARAVVAKCADSGIRIPVLIEIDSDGHRAGVRPVDPLLLEIAHTLHRGGAELRGVLTHAGGSYDALGMENLILAAEQERAAAVHCAQRLRDAQLPCPVISVGSTPTAHFSRDLSGVTEVRAGVFVFFDLVMAGIGVCSVDDVAISVLASVIGHQSSKGQIIVDAGWMALSRDRGTATQKVDQGYGLVCDIEGRPFEDLVVTQANQEHGVLGLRPGAQGMVPDLPVGTQVRILPNHACATSAQHDHYHVVEANEIIVQWRRIPAGW